MMILGRISIWSIAALTLVIFLAFTPHTMAAKAKPDPQVVKMEKDARAAIVEISAKELKGMIDRKEKFVLIDVREENEFKAGHIKGAASIPRGILEWVLTSSFKRRDIPIVFYCRTGARSALTTKLAQDLGYTNVKNVKGSIKEWTERGYEVYNQTGAFKLIPKGFGKRERIGK